MMMNYLDSFVEEKRRAEKPLPLTDKTDRTPFVSSVSGSPACSSTHVASHQFRQTGKSQDCEASEITPVRVDAPRPSLAKLPRCRPPRAPCGDALSTPAVRLTRRITPGVNATRATGAPRWRYGPALAARDGGGCPGTARSSAAPAILPWT